MRITLNVSMASKKRHASCKSWPKRNDEKSWAKSLTFSSRMLTEILQQAATATRRRQSPCLAVNEIYNSFEIKQMSFLLCQSKTCRGSTQSFLDSKCLSGWSNAPFPATLESTCVQDRFLPPNQSLAHPRRAYPCTPDKDMVLERQTTLTVPHGIPGRTFLFETVRLW